MSEQPITATTASGNTVGYGRAGLSIRGADGTLIRTYEATDFRYMVRHGAVLSIYRVLSDNPIEVEFADATAAADFEHAVDTLRKATMPARTETMVREYETNTDFQNDARRLAMEGWSVASTTERQPAIGCARGCLLGLMSLVFRPKPVIVVTYQRTVH